MHTKNIIRIVGVVSGTWTLGITAAQVPPQTFDTLTKIKYGIARRNEREVTRSTRGGVLYAASCPETYRYALAYPRVISIFDVGSTAGKKGIAVPYDAATFGSVRAMGFSASGDVLAVGFPGSVLLAHITEGFNRMLPHRDSENQPTMPVDAVALNRAGSRLLTASLNDARLFDTGTGQLLFVLSGGTRPIVSVHFADGDRKAVATYQDGTVRVWAVETGSLVGAFSCPEGSITCAFVHETGGKSLLFAGTEIGNIAIWDLADGKYERFAQFRTPIRSLAPGIALGFLGVNMGTNVLVTNMKEVGISGLMMLPSAAKSIWFSDARRVMILYEDGTGEERRIDGPVIYTYLIGRGNLIRKNPSLLLLFEALQTLSSQGAVTQAMLQEKLGENYARAKRVFDALPLTVRGALTAYYKIEFSETGSPKRPLEEVEEASSKYARAV